MALHTVTWTKIETYHGTVDVPEGEIATDWLDGDDGQELLEGLCEPNARDAQGVRIYYENQGCEIGEVALLSDPTGASI